MAAIVGTEFDDPDLTGTPGDDTIDALGGNDIANGGGGDDTVNGGDGDDVLGGGRGDNVLNGGAGDDILRGFVGVDSYFGGAGFDQVNLGNAKATQGIVANLSTHTVLNDGFGNTETLNSIEAFGHGTVFADSFTGDAHANLFQVAAGDTANGLGGADQFWITDAPALIDGGAGVDTIAGFLQFRVVAGPGGPVVETTTNGVIVSLLTGQIIDDGFGGSGQILRVENLSGSAGVDTLTGDDLANVIHGRNGSDNLFGMGGNDVLYGEAGGDNLSGGDGDDRLVGGTGYNVMDGGAGNDILDGRGAGGVFAYDQASYADATGGVAVNLSIRGPQDTVAGGFDTLIAIEDLRGSDYGDSLWGNQNGNVIYAGGGDDVVYGRNGGDLIYAGAGADEVNGDVGFDTIYGEDGADVLRGGDGDDNLDGGDGADVLDAGLGSDRMTGGAGADFMAGGQQADIFVYTAATDSTVADPDTIADMTLEDFIDLTALDVLDYTMVTGDRHVDLTVNLTGGEVMLMSITGYVDTTHILV